MTCKSLEWMLGANDKSYLRALGRINNEVDDSFNRRSCREGVNVLRMHEDINRVKMDCIGHTNYV